MNDIKYKILILIFAFQIVKTFAQAKNEIPGINQHSQTLIAIDSSEEEILTARAARYYALKKLDEGTSDIFIYTNTNKFNKLVTIIQGLNDKDAVKPILQELKKSIGTGGTYKNGIIILQGNHLEYVKKYLVNKNIIKRDRIR